MPFSTGQDDLFQLDQDAFDFNVQFEQLFFSIIPSVLFIVSSLWRTISQVRKPTVVDAPIFRIAKLGAITTYLGLELSLLILLATSAIRTTPLFIAASALKLLTALLMMTLSLVDHAKSPRPSVLLTSYLFLTLLLDAAQARTLFLLSSDRQQPELAYSSIFAATVGLKVGILALEARRKASWVRWADEKEHSPEETSGIFELGVFAWLNGVFAEGYRRVLRVEDLYPLDGAMDGQVLKERFRRACGGVEFEKGGSGKFWLLKVLVKALRAELVFPIVPRVALLGFVFCQPLFIEKLLDHLGREDGVEERVGFGFIGAAVLIYTGIAVSRSLYWYFHHRFRTMVRSVLVTEIYVKATRARIGSGDDSAAITLMSTDIERITMGLFYIHDIWAGVIQVGIASWLLYSQIGVAFVAPMAIVAACCIGLVILVKFTGDSQRNWMAGVQKRVGLTATVIASMKNLKISGLSAAVGDFVQKLRVEELAAGSRYRKITIIAALFGFIPFLFSAPLTFAIAQRSLDVGRMFTSLSYLLLLTEPLLSIFQAIPHLLSALACLGRIQAFLESETRQDTRQILSDMRHESEKSVMAGDIQGSLSDQGVDADPITVKDGKFGWEADKFALQNVNIRIPKSSLTIVVGPVGSGKSTLCKALLGEIPYSDGRVTLSTRFPHVGFCEQTAFLSNGSIRDNIIGFSPFDSERYTQVIQATALVFDFAVLPQGDRTNIGSDGITLSGGQKQRLSLARTLYLQSDLLVLDDIFSGLDADTEEQVFRQVFGPDGLLRQRRTTVVLCTHSIKHLPAADYIIALGEGTVAEQGNFGELMSRPEGYVQRLGVKDSSSEDGDSASSSSGTSKAAKKSTRQLLHPTTTNGTGALSISPEGEVSRQMGDKTVYKTYVKSMGVFLAAVSLLFSVLWGFFTNFPTVWLTYWTNDVYSENPTHSYAYYAGIFALFQFCGLMSLLGLAICIFVLSVRRAGANLHQDALRTLILAPLRFFTSTDTGVVTNLFSQDLNLIDTELPNSLLNVLFCVFSAIGQAAVMLTSSYYLIISYPFLLAILYYVQKFYLRTSRQLRLLDLETKSPLYTHFLDTLKGITTLRAFGFISDEVQKNVRLINTSQRPAYLLYMVQQWLSLILDMVVMLMAAVLTTLAVRLHSNSGFTGASLVTLMGFGENLSGIVLFYTKLETSIGAIGRLKMFNETVKPEDREEEDVVPPLSWPERGEVELKGVCASYDEEGKGDDDGGSEAERNLVLRDINLTIKSGEKIAVCGRTGSGKSSLVGLLLKLLDATSETADNATIDQTPLRRLDRQTLRQRIIAVPQEAVFLPDGSTFRANLDPLDLATAGECEDVLRAVGLWEFVVERGGLEEGMTAGTMSAGQRQLLSLGRALLRRRERARSLAAEVGSGGGDGGRGILLLDEVSSSVDHETERVMQDIIREEFEGYTVVAVSHRLDMIMDFDRVVVLDKGMIVEVGNPVVLAERGEASRFGELVIASRS